MRVTILDTHLVVAQIEEDRRHVAAAAALTSAARVRAMAAVGRGVGRGIYITHDFTLHKHRPCTSGYATAGSFRNGSTRARSHSVTGSSTISVQKMAKA